MKIKRVWLSRSAAASLLSGLFCLFAANNQQAQVSLGGVGSINVGGSSSTTTTTTTGTTTYRGESAVVAGTALGLGLSVSDTGPLASCGGARETSLLQGDLYGMVSAEVCHAATIGQQDVAYSEAAAGKVGFTTCNMVPIGGNTVSADFVMSRALASCCTSGASVSGFSEIAGLVINGQAVFVTGQPNQTVWLAGGSRVVINEQIASQTETTADITVNALHIVLCEGADVVVSASSAGVTCNGAPSGGNTECNDFVTGGGWITGTPSGAKANFGVGGGFEDGAFWGHLNYIDHGNGMHVKATAVTGYAVDPNDADCRIIDYDVTIDGDTGTARVRVCDKGEPGRDDIFQIQLSDGYFAGGDLGGSHPGGGNIQLHKCQ